MQKRISPELQKLTTAALIASTLITGCQNTPPENSKLQSSNDSDSNISVKPNRSSSTTPEEINPILSPGRLIDSLNERYPRKYAFSAKTADETIVWQKELREKLIELLGGFPDEKVPLNPKILSTSRETKKLPDNTEYAYTKETVLFEAQPGETVMAYLLIPEEKLSKKRTKNGKLPCVICLAGHGMGADSITGFHDDGTPREHFDGYQKDFALQCVTKGYAAFVIEQLAVGHRRKASEIEKRPRRSTCGDTYHQLLLFGKTLIGVRTYDVIRAIDYLQTRENIDNGNITVLGVSGGGTTGLFAAALDSRIKCALISGYLSSFTGTLMVQSHCACNYIPGILKYCDLSDIAGLIAPRPLFFEIGNKDPISPIAPVKKAYSQIEKVYSKLNASDELNLSIFDGTHQFDGKDAFLFLERVQQTPATKSKSATD